jgi:Bax inhibitor 1
MGTSIVFACFSAAALFADRRMILFTAGVISSLAALLFWAAIVNIFLRSEMLFDIRMYLGLAMFSLFVVFDTQVIIFDCQHNNKYDVVDHALQFFFDFINIFVRLLVMLNKKESKKEKKKE